MRFKCKRKITNAKIYEDKRDLYCMLIGSSVFLVGSVVYPVRSLIRDRWVFLHWVGCTVVVLVLASVFFM